MASNYFENFPDVIYNGQRCKDITRRSIIRSGNTTSPYSFYPFVLSESLRADHISEYYYEDSSLDWLVLLSNEIIDPYFGWYNTEEQLEESINEKCGSLAIAQQKILYYRNNWPEDSVQITPSYYSTNLAKNLRKYYVPVYGARLDIIAYKRKEEDIVQNTNQIIEYQISANNGNFAFEIGELVDIKVSGTDTKIGNGEIITANSTIFRIKNVAGNTIANSSLQKDFIGKNSGANLTSNNSLVLFENISNTELVFYSPVTYYDYEVELNESRKNLSLIGDGVQDLFINEFETQMKRDVNQETGLVEE